KPGLHPGASAEGLAHCRRGEFPGGWHFASHRPALRAGHSRADAGGRGADAEPAWLQASSGAARSSKGRQAAGQATAQEPTAPGGALEPSVAHPGFGRLQGRDTASVVASFSGATTLNDILRYIASSALLACVRSRLGRGHPFARPRASERLLE